MNLCHPTLKDCGGHDRIAFLFSISREIAEHSLQSHGEGLQKAFEGMISQLMPVFSNRIYSIYQKSHVNTLRDKLRKQFSSLEQLASRIMSVQRLNFELTVS